MVTVKTDLPLFYLATFQMILQQKIILHLSQSQTFSLGYYKKYELLHLKL